MHLVMKQENGSVICLPVCFQLKSSFKKHLLRLALHAPGREKLDLPDKTFYY